MGPKLITSRLAIAAAALAGFTVMLPVTAQAISRVQTQTAECSAIRGLLVREGAAILRYTSKKGLPIYDRYVRSSVKCQHHEVGVWRSVPARDTRSCRVIACISDFGDDSSGNFRPFLQITK